MREETSKTPSRKEERFSIRASRRQKTVIAQAAKIKEQSLTEFVLVEAYEAAQQVIAEQTHFVLAKKNWEAFCQALDAPARPIPALRQLLTEPGLFDA